MRAVIPGQAAGTLVTFSYRARDLELARLAEAGQVDPALGLWVEHDETTAPETSFRYLSGFQRPQIRFNEVLPENLTVLQDAYPPEVQADPNFKLPDFAELYNAGDLAYDLGGMYLSDSANVPGCPPEIVRKLRRFRIPDDTVIEAKGFVLLLFVDQRNNAPNLDPELAERTVLVDAMRLDDCRETLILAADLKRSVSLERSSMAGASRSVRYDSSNHREKSRRGAGSFIPRRAFASKPMKEH